MMDQPAKTHLNKYLTCELFQVNLKNPFLISPFFFISISLFIKIKGLFKTHLVALWYEKSLWWEQCHPLIKEKRKRKRKNYLPLAFFFFYYTKIFQLNLLFLWGWRVIRQSTCFSGPVCVAIQIYSQKHDTYINSYLSISLNFPPNLFFSFVQLVSSKIKFYKFVNSNIIQQMVIFVEDYPNKVQNPRTSQLQEKLRGNIEKQASQKGKVESSNSELISQVVNIYHWKIIDLYQS